MIIVELLSKLFLSFKQDNEKTKFLKLSPEDIEQISGKEIYRILAKYPEIYEKFSKEVKTAVMLKLLFSMKEICTQDQARNDAIASSQSYIDDPQYGLEPNKPAFFPGMFYEQLLMIDLKYNGFPVVITTRHPLTVDNIDNIVDCYSFKFLDDNINGKVPDIYVSFYTSVKLKKLPRGFTRGN